MEGFNNGGQVPAYGNEKTPQQVIENLRQQLLQFQSQDAVKELELCRESRLRHQDLIEKQKKELEELKAWKAQALACTPDWQAIGRALHLKLGTSVSDQVLPEILNLLKDRHELVIQLRRQQAYCKGQVKGYETTARYREVEEILDKHHHSTETL